jgi:phospholipase C
MVAVLLVGSVATDARAQAAYCPLRAGALYFPDVPPGTPNRDIPIEHIIILMQENRSFDQYFGMLNEYGYDGEVDGLTSETNNPDEDGNPFYVYHENRYCVTDVDHSWTTGHIQHNNGRNDGFVRTTGGDNRTMGYYHGEDLPYYYALANTFAIGDRYFSSVMGPTMPNRLFSTTGSAWGHIRNRTVDTRYTRPFITEILDQYRITWKQYGSEGDENSAGAKSDNTSDSPYEALREFFEDLSNGRLPQVVFMELEGYIADEHAPANIQIGQRVMARVINEIMNSPAWPTSAIFLTYDENGGFFDHVPPPPACAPDDISPRLESGDYQAEFDHYGFRVPMTVVSPYVKRHYVSHEIYDHTSLLRFIEAKWNLPALTNRDANANPMLDFFDFDNPQMDVPTIPVPDIDPAGMERCRRDGYPMPEYY